MSLSSSVRVLLLAVLPLATTGCSAGAEGANQPQAAALKQREAARVRAEPVAQREMVRTLESTTVVESEKEIKLYPRASGTLLELAVEEGDAVEAGAVLARLDPREAQAKVDDAGVARKEALDSAIRLEIL